MNKSKIILNTPCMPKGSYHVGNAISQIMTDVVAAFHRVMDPQQQVFYVNHAWNVHGLPFERLYTQAIGRPGTYAEIYTFAEQHIEAALTQKAYFADYRPQTHNFTFLDADSTSIITTIECFHRLARQGYVVEQEGACYLNLEKFLQCERETWQALVHQMHVVPAYHRPSILAQQQTLCGFFPLTKPQRVFVPSVTYHHTCYSLNPIFQSLVYPCIIATSCHTELPTLLQASASGHGMLKWHYLRSILCYLLTGTLPYQHLLLHGTLLGADATPMSKHKQNSIQPSDLFQRRADPAFVRYVLLKSLSAKDVPLQLEAAEHEYERIVHKGTLVQSGHFQLHNEQDIIPLLMHSLALLKDYQLKHAFEHFYLAMKKAHIEASSTQNSHALIARMYDIFLNARR
jgi:valyl-tRNA synthetase